MDEYTQGSVNNMTRKETLQTAIDIVTVGRAKMYDGPETNFARIAEFWSTYLNMLIEPKDVAAMMGLLKIARIASGNVKADSWVDLAGYAACGCEIETEADA